MKLAFSTVACPEWTIAEAISTARELGYQGIDFRTFGHDSREFLPDPCMTGSEKIRHLCQDAGVQPMCLSTSIRYDEPIFPPILGRAIGGTHTSVLQTKEMVHIAAKAEIPHVRVFAFEFQNNEDWRDGTRRIVERLEMAARTARHTGVKLVVENGGSFSTAEHMKRLLDAVASPLVSVAYSPAVAMAAGEDPVEGMKSLGGSLSIVKIKDLDDGRPVSLGTGNIGIDSVLRTIPQLKSRPWMVYELDRLWMTGLPEPREELAHAAEHVYAVFGGTLAAR